MKRLFFSVIVLFSSILAFSQPKYIFYMIGDGMGINQVLGTEMMLAEMEGQIGRKQLCMTQFPYASVRSNYSSSNSITDSSAAGTCLASGQKTKNGRLGLNAKNESVRSIAEILHQEGWAVGIMTSVSIDHATPAAFYAHVGSRNDYYTIGTQLATSGFDFFGGATFYHPFLADKPEQPNVYDLCEQNGYTFFHGYQDFMRNSATAQKAILIQEFEGLKNDYEGNGKIPYAIDRKAGDLTLEEITKSAIDFLSKKDKPFFMMVEGGQIDWACHSNDGAAVMKEVLDFDMAIRQVYDFYLAHPDETLIVITADHETGGMALGNSNYTLNLKVLDNQKVSSNVISDRLKDLQDQYKDKLTYEQVKSLFKETLGLYGKVDVSKEEDAALQSTFKKMMKKQTADTKTLYASLNALSDQAVALLNKKAKLGWTTRSHSAGVIPVFAIGVGADQFSGFGDMTNIMPTILHIATEK